MFTCYWHLPIIHACVISISYALDYSFVKQILSVISSTGRVHSFQSYLLWHCIVLLLLQGETFCKYKLYLDHEYTCTKSVSGTINPSYESEKKFTFNPVTKQVTKCCSNLSWCDIISTMGTWLSKMENKTKMCSQIATKIKKKKERNT